jgi:hypothetical protein
MVNKPRNLGTFAESGVVEYLRTHGFPHAERRSLNGALDRGDVTGCPGLCIEVKYAGSGLQLGSWLIETGVERINAAAEYGILVVKPAGLGVKKTGSWYAAMYASEFNRLWLQGLERQESMAPILRHSDVAQYTAGYLRTQLSLQTRPGQLGDREVVALLLRPPGTKDKPDQWYRVLTLEHMVRLLHAAGYGDGSESVDGPVHGDGS